MASDSCVDDLVVSSPLAPVKRAAPRSRHCPAQLISPTPAHAHTYTSVRCQTAAGRRAQCAVDVAQDEHHPPCTCAACWYIRGPRALCRACPWDSRARLQLACFGGSGVRPEGSSQPSRASRLFPSFLPASPLRLLSARYLTARVTCGAWRYRCRIVSRLCLARAACCRCRCGPTRSCRCCECPKSACSIMDPASSSRRYVSLFLSRRPVLRCCRTGRCGDLGGAATAVSGHPALLSRFFVGNQCGMWCSSGGNICESTALFTYSLSGRARVLRLVFFAAFVLFFLSEPTLSLDVMDSGGELNVDSIIERLLEVRCCSVLVLFDW